MASRTLEATSPRGRVPEPPSPRRGSRRVVLLGAGVLAAAVVLVVATRGSDPSKVSATKSPSTTAGAAAGGGAGSQTAGAGVAGSTASGAAASQGGGATNPVPAKPSVPLNVSVSNTKGLRDGDAVSIHITPKSGSVIYGFEAFLCKGGVAYDFDADVRPTVTGNCASRPLSAHSDRYLAVPAAPPYTVADGVFHVGVGTDTYRTRDGQTATVTCGPRDACTLVLKLQYPYNFAFESIPLTLR